MDKKQQHQKNPNFPGQKPGINPAQPANPQQTPGKQQNPSQQPRNPNSKW